MDFAAEHKIVCEFSLTPAGKKRLGDFLDGHIAVLKAGGHQAAEAERQLQDLVRETFPPEALEELGKILSGKSEYALLVRNCPEHSGKKFASEQDAYSYHIGRAIYSISNARSIASRVRTRHRGEDHYDGELLGSHIHRDFLTGETPDRHAEYVIFSSPYNDEHASTQVIQLRQALESIPGGKRPSVKIGVSQKHYITREEKETICDVTRVIELLSHPDPGFFVSQVSCDHPSFYKAIAAHSARVNLQPGDLLVINENAMFHKAHEGTVSHILLPTTVSRVIIHHAGGPALP